MNLHHDQEAFREFVIAASNELQIPPGIIEKDYYVIRRRSRGKSQAAAKKGGCFFHRVSWILCLKPWRNP